MDHSLEVVPGVLLLCGIRGYVHIVACNAMFLHLQATHDDTVCTRGR
jgi:hypothetical protein